MKKIAYLICSAFLLSGISLSAMQQTAAKNHGTQYQNHEERMKKVEDHLQMDTRYYDHLSSYVANMYLNAEFLYWAGENEGFGIGFNTIDAENTIIILNRDFEYGPGFRVGLGFKPLIDWDMYFSYTRFHHSTKKKFSGSLFPLNVPMSGQIERMKSSFKIKYDILDLEFGRPFHVGQTLAFKPHIGLRGGWIKQEGYNAGFDNIEPPSPGDPVAPISISYYEKLWTIGPRAGFEADLFFSKNYGFNIYGNFSGALMYANVEYIGKHTYTEYPDTPVPFTLIGPKRDDLIAALQCAIGLAWGDFLTEGEDVALQIRAGWECNYWWDLYSSLEFVYFEHAPPGAIGDTSAQDITESLLLQGLTVSARLDF